MISPGRNVTKVASMFDGKLPIMADSDTRLDAVAAEQSGLRYQFTLVNVASNEINKDAFMTALRSSLFSQACLRPDLRPILDNGASVTYQYNGKANALVASLTVTENECP